MKNIFVALALVGSLVACDLDNTPYNSLSEENSIESTTDIKRMTSGMYSLLRGRSYGSYDMYPDLCTEDFVATVSFGNTYSGAAFWNQRNSADDYLVSIWQETYFLIANANRLINERNRAEYTTAEDSVILQEALGAAYTVRALAYTKLASYFALPYYSDKNGGTFNKDSLGVPLELDVDLSKHLPRATLEQVYKQINADLDSATVYMTALAESGEEVATYKGSPSRFNIDAVNALRARVALYQGEWSKALESAEAVVNSGKYPLSSTQNELNQLWANDQGTEIITHLYIDKDETPNTHGALFAYSQNYRGYLLYTSSFLPTEKSLELYEDDDFRFDAYYSQNYLIIDGNIIGGLYSLSKFPRTTEFDPSGNTAHSPIIFRSAEAYLIAAEAAARLGDDAKAQTYVNDLRVSRGLTATTSTGATLLAEIQLERRKEFMGEGLNLIDKKRWYQGVDRATMGGQTTMTRSGVFDPTLENALQQTYPAGHPRFVFPIPFSETTNNVNVVQNPGY